MIIFRTFKAKTELKETARKRSKSRCHFCGITQDQNYDPNDGKLYLFDLIFLDGNSRNQNPSNLALGCRREKSKVPTPYMLFDIKTGRIQ